MAYAITYSSFGGPEVLIRTEIEPTPPSRGEVAVRVEAIGVNPIEHKLRSGLRASSPIVSPRRLGSDAAGIITAVGDDVDGFRVGDAVAIAGASGAYASEFVVSAARVWPRPAAVTAAAAAALGIPAGTAYQTLRSLAVGAGDTLLVHGGSGAVGQAVIQYATLWGASVIATTSDRRAERVRELGAVPVSYEPGVESRVRAAATDGITAAIDIAGTDEALAASLALVADHSRVATLVRGRDADALGIRAFSGGSPRPLTAQQEQWRAEAMPTTLSLLAARAFSVELGPQLPLADADEAHRLVEAGVDGKVILVP